MKVMKKAIFLALLGITAAAMAVPAYPHLIRFTQPCNGDTIRIYLRGDEKVHWAETEDGYTLLHAKDGSLVYAVLNEKGEMIPSQMVASSPERRTLKAASLLSATPKGLRFSKAQVKAMRGLWDDLSKMKKPAKEMTNVLGEKKFLVVLFAFKDKPFTHTAQEFEALFNQVNYTANNNAGSVHDYYYEVSQGLFSLNVDVVGPFTSVLEMAHYGDTYMGPQDMAKECVDSAARFVDFSDYDNDNDGYIDGMHIIFAGTGEEASGNAAEVWSHKWNIFGSPTYNNTVVNVYSCSPECSGANAMNNALTSVGVICHELGHVFGAPDYYDVDYAEGGGQYPGLGAWDIMSGGSWNGNGHTPAQHNPYTKIYIYHWATCDTLSSPRQVRMRSADVSSTDFHRINTSAPNDFFLLENRQRNRWDAMLPGNGMLAYHIHADASVDQYGNSSHPMQTYLLALTATDTLPNSDPASYGIVNSATTPLPGAARRRNLNDYTTPSLRPWTNARDGQSLSYIQENASTQCVYFCFGDVTPSPIALSAEGASDSEVLLSWEGYGSSTTIILCRRQNVVPTLPISAGVGDTVDGDALVIYKGTGNQYLHGGLAAGEQYYYFLYNILDGSTLTTPLSASATTRECAATAWRDANLETGELPGCWVNEDKLYAAPFTTDSGLADRHFVLTLRVRPTQLTRDTLTVWLKRSVYAEWQPIYTTRVGANNHDDTLYIPLYGCSSYTRLAIEQDPNVSNRCQLLNMQLTPGCLLHCYVKDGVGGQIVPAGYSIQPQDSMVRIVLRRAPGYKFHMLFVDGHRVRPAYDTLYKVTMDTGHVAFVDYTRDLGVTETQAAQPRLYPSPTRDVLHVETIQPVAMTLIDMMGRVVGRVRPTSGRADIDMSRLSPGIYLLRMGEKAYKVVKE